MSEPWDLNKINKLICDLKASDTQNVVIDNQDVAEAMVWLVGRLQREPFNNGENDEIPTW